jgi:hypothetical protein
MKIKKIFWLILLFVIFLAIGCIVWSLQNNHQKTYIKGQLRYEDIPIKKTITESQKDINKLLLTHPIKFIKKGDILEENQTLIKIVSILNNTIGDMVIRVESYSDSNGSNSFNRKLTQKRADNIASFIQKGYKAKFIDAIGYGEEFPLPKDSNKSNDRIEIYLKRIYP